MGKMLDEVLAVSGWFQDFVLKLALLLPIEYDSEEDLTDVDCLNAVGLPFFVRPPNMPASAPES